MAIVDVELARIQFAGFIENIVTSAPIPFPTFAVIGPDRLISRLECIGFLNDLFYGGAISQPRQSCQFLFCLMKIVPVRLAGE